MVLNACQLRISKEIAGIIATGISEEEELILLAIEDVTDQKKIEKEQRLVQLGKLMADMAHEINNPLAVISGRAQLSLKGEIINEKIKDNLEIILEEFQRAGEIVQRLLKFSKPSNLTKIILLSA